MRIYTERDDIQVINAKQEMFINEKNVDIVPTDTRGFITYMHDDMHAVVYMMVPGDTLFSSGITVNSKFEVGDYVQLEEDASNSELHYVVQDITWSKEDKKLKYKVSSSTPRGVMYKVHFYEESELYSVNKDKTEHS